MQLTDRNRLSAKMIEVITFVVSTVVLAIPYMQIPYSQLSLPNALIGVGLIAPIIGAALSRVLGSPFRSSLLCAAAALPAVVLIRIGYDLMNSSDTHNLWPFEIVIASILGALAGATGAGLGNLARHLLGKESDEE